MKVRIKPCPFCGGRGVYQGSKAGGHEGQGSTSVACEDCGASSPLTHRGNARRIRNVSKEDAVKAWNERPNERP